MTLGLAAERAAARATAYRLFGRLFAREVTPDLLPTLAVLPELGEALPAPFDADGAAAEHQRLFGLQVPPWAGVFLDAEGRIGGDTARVVRDLYTRAGLELDERSEEADHVGHALALLAELEDDALAAETLDRALLPWLPWLVEAVERHGGPFHRALAGLTLELALDHRSALAAPPGSATESTDEPELLDDERAGLRSIAEFLVTPARCGVYLARDDIRRLGAEGGLPTGFGARADTLETLLRAAAEYDDLERVVDGLLKLVAAGRGACGALADAGVPATAGAVALRRARLDRTERALARLSAAATSLDSGQDDSSSPGTFLR